MMLTSCLNESSQRACDGPPHRVGTGTDLCDIGATTGRLGERLHGRLTGTFSVRSLGAANTRFAPERP